MPSPLRLLSPLPLCGQGAGLPCRSLSATVQLGLQGISLGIQRAHNAAQLSQLSVAALQGRG